MCLTLSNIRHSPGRHLYPPGAERQPWSTKDMTEGAEAAGTGGGMWLAGPSPCGQYGEQNTAGSPHL